jgi:CRISPR-associated protein Csd2
MEVHKVYWWNHSSKLGQYSSAKVHRSLKVYSTTPEPKRFEDYTIELEELDGLNVEVINGR